MLVGESSNPFHFCFICVLNRFNLLQSQGNLQISDPFAHRIVLISVHSLLIAVIHPTYLLYHIRLR